MEQLLNMFLRMKIILHKTRRLTPGLSPGLREDRHDDTMTPCQHDNPGSLTGLLT